MMTEGDRAVAGRRVVAWVPYPQLLAHAAPGDEIRVVTAEAEPPGAGAGVEFWAWPHPVPRSWVDLLPHLPRLRVVQLISSGYDHVLPGLPPGVTLCNAPGLRAAPTAEVALSLMLASVNDMATWHHQQRHRRWSWLAPRAGLSGKTILLVGYGAVGTALHRMLSGFNVEVMVTARRARPGVAGPADLPALIPRADIIVLATALTSHTRGLFGAELIGRMKPGALLVNVSRGEVVDTAALMRALREGRITAALDVTDPEPLPPDHPLWDCPGLVISPHVGGNVASVPERAVTFLAEQLRRYRCGEDLLHRVAPEPLHGR